MICGRTARAARRRAAAMCRRQYVLGDIQSLYTALVLHGKKIVVVMPAYNAEQTLVATHREIPHDFVDEVILVDDGSNDNTAALSRRLGITTIVHAENRGYGANQKT